MNTTKNEGDQSDILEVKFYPIGLAEVEPVLMKIGQKPVMIGRASNTSGSKNKINLNSLVTSRKHAFLWSQEGKIFIKDNDSSTGTYVNGQKIGKGTSDSSGRVLYDQDIIRFGEDLEIDGVIHKSEMFKMEFATEKVCEVRDVGNKIAELKVVAKDGYENIWNNIVSGIYNDVESHINQRVPEQGTIKKIFAKVRSPNSADIT